MALKAASSALSNSRKTSSKPVVMSTAVNNLFEKIMDDPVTIPQATETKDAATVTAEQ